jgi:predicted GNAT family acetyltransferase
MTETHPLDRPVWNALASRQAYMAAGDARARRFPAEFGPFAAAADGSPESRAALAALIPDHGGLAVVETTPWEPPPGARVAQQFVLHQMLAAPALAPDDSGLEFIALGEADAPEMQELAALTQPGPFSTRTHELGDFFGIRRDGRLAAMAGERMRPEGFCEVSAVCTHPGHRGRGYGAALTRLVASRITARGEVPFLHVMATNTGAIGLYETLGFALRRALALTVLAPERSAS